MSEDAGELEGFKLVYTPSSRFGELRLLAREEPATFWVRASGGITPALLRKDLEIAAAFGRGHPNGWVYVADIRQVRWVHPGNVVQLLKIRSLPNLASWVVVTGHSFLRTAQSWMPPALRADHVFENQGEALRHVDAVLNTDKKAPVPRRTNSN